MERIKGANGELMKYSMQPMDGKGHLTLYRYEQLAVGGADNAHLEFWIEIEELRKQLADAQVTIAALQARVQELEQWVQDQSTTNLETMRHMDEMQSRAMDAESQLTQRTAELEAAKAERNSLKGHYRRAYGRAANAEARVRDLQADLERVRERVGQRGLEVVMIGKVGHYVSTAVKEELERVRALVKTYADAKIDFDDKRLQEDHHAWKERYNKLVEAENALLQHRQGMG